MQWQTGALKKGRVDGVAGGRQTNVRISIAVSEFATLSVSKLIILDHVITKTLARASTPSMQTEIHAK